MLSLRPGASVSEHKTTKRHFAVFEAEVRRLLKLWNLVDWEVRVTHEKCDSLATCEPRGISRICIIRLATKWGPLDTPTDERMRASARHEVAHLVTGELVMMARSRYVTEDEVTAAIETTARRLERMLP